MVQPAQRLYRTGSSKVCKSETLTVQKDIKVIVTGPVTVSNLKITVQWLSNGYTVTVTLT